MLAKNLQIAILTPITESFSFTPVTSVMSSYPWTPAGTMAWTGLEEERYRGNDTGLSTCPETLLNIQIASVGSFDVDCGYEIAASFGTVMGGPSNGAAAAAASAAPAASAASAASASASAAAAAAAPATFETLDYAHSFGAQTSASDSSDGQFAAACAAKKCKSLVGDFGAGAPAAAASRPKLAVGAQAQYKTGQHSIFAPPDSTIPIRRMYSDSSSFDTDLSDYDTSSDGQSETHTSYMLLADPDSSNLDLKLSDVSDHQLSMSPNSSELGSQHSPNVSPHVSPHVSPLRNTISSPSESRAVPEYVYPSMRGITLGSQQSSSQQLIAQQQHSHISPSPLLMAQPRALPPSQEPHDIPYGHYFDEQTRVSLLKHQGMWEEANVKKRGKLACSECGKYRWKAQRFATVAELAAHLDKEHPKCNDRFTCPKEKCVWSVVGFASLTEQRRHISNIHGRKTHSCPLCSKVLQRSDGLIRHMRTVHKPKDFELVA